MFSGLDIFRLFSTVSQTWKNSRDHLLPSRPNHDVGFLCSWQRKNILHNCSSGSLTPQVSVQFVVGTGHKVMLSNYVKAWLVMKLINEA